MVAEQEAIANEIKAGASVEEAVAFLEQDPSRKLYGTDALQKWMQETERPRRSPSSARRHFDIAEPDPQARECMIAPTKEGGIYYTGPDRRLLPSRPHVVVGARGRRGVRHLARAHHGVPRGRPGPPPADRAGRVQPRAARTS